MASVWGLQYHQLTLVCLGYSSPPGPSAGTGLDYLDALPTQAGDLRYNQEQTSTSLTLDHTHPHYSLPIYPPSGLDSAAHYPHDGGGNYYQTTSNAYPEVEAKHRYGPSATPQAGLENTPRTTTLPNPESRPGHFNIRNQFANVVPNFTRPSDPYHSPSMADAHHRHGPISPSPSLPARFNATPTTRMDPQFNRGASNSIPPLEDIQLLGTLSYTDPHKTNVDVSISGIIDKGFFLADKHWTCYRRNYFSCVCSFSLTPYLPGVAIELKMPGQRHVTICGFAMSISAVIADNSQPIDLVQHTPKRDKGPTMSPPKIPVMAKQDNTHHHHMSYFGGGSGMSSQQTLPDGWVPSEQGGNVPFTECTFERIQFKQATQNNGKRRAQQQYYHLVVELYANTNFEQPSKPNWTRIAYRKSAQMIVRGRSPGHYQDRRGSSSNPPAGSGGNSGHFGLAGSVRDFGVSSLMQQQPYPTFDGHFLGHHHHRQHPTLPLPTEAMIPPEEEKAIENTKGYQYYPGGICDGQSSQRVDPWNHHPESEPMAPQLVTGVDIHGKVKNEYENNTLPRLVHPHSLNSTDQARSCRPFDGKPTSNGYYPHMSPSSMSLTMQ